RRFADQAYRRVMELDPLSRTPLLLNVGLGATMLVRDSTSFHFTLLDKIGLVGRWGARREWEAGAFVGGFLESIVRAATNSSDSRFAVQAALLSGAGDGAERGGRS
ncbi:MAG TPA: hypothetical protein VL403_19365, partial [Candidatus Kryptonia bacterium]|nr:hypothetical protein [Candidatus Kryptonia bacterium]